MSSADHTGAEIKPESNPLNTSESTGLLPPDHSHDNSLRAWFCRRFALYYDWKLVDYDRWVSNKFSTLMNEIDLLNISDKDSEKNDLDVLKPLYYKKLNEMKREYVDPENLGLVKQPTVRDLLLLEKCLIRFLPPVELSLKSLLIEAHYRNIVGQKIFDDVKKTFTSDKLDTPAGIVDRRSELCFMLDHIQDIYTNAPVRDGARSSLLRFSLFTVISVYGGIFLLLLLLNLLLHYTNNQMIPLAAMVVPFMGSLGAFISVTQRAQTLSNDGDSVQNAMKLNCGLFAITFGIIISGLFAVIINLFFLAGYIQGEMFPYDKTNVPDGLAGAFVFLLNLQNLSGIMIAKILIWSVVAGFSERLIPDNLSRLQDTLTSPDRKGQLSLNEMKTTSTSASRAIADAATTDVQAAPATLATPAPAPAVNN
ncbi:MAG: hypothetical protein ACKO85_21445 [Isosphaeraceae bacterium]